MVVSSANHDEAPKQGICDLSLNNDKEKGVDFFGDTPYNVKIIPVHSEPFDIQVSSFELVQELHRVLMDREESCHCTCFSLVLNGQTLDMFAELKNIEGFVDGAEIKVVEELYDAYVGREQMSLSFVNSIVGDMDRKMPLPDPSDLQPPSYILPNNSSLDSLPLFPLHPIERDGKSIRCLKQLNFSNWNPPPSSRRLSGDLIYVFVHTMEDKRYHITACPRGFFINMSTDDEFNPHPIPSAHVSHSLVDLLRFYSPGFKRSFDSLLKRRASKHPFERVTAPYQVFSWLSPSFEHTPDSIRKEEAFSSRMACEENLPGQTRDWNEELQVTRELKQTQLCERLLRDRAVFKSNSDFVAAATRAAVSVINGDIMAINPGENRKQQMYIWNNMFFSLGFDVKDHYKHFGGEHAAYVATSGDLSGVRAYSMLDESGLHTLGTAIIDYRGYRITAQTIIPGILEKEQEQLVVYGSTDFGKTVLSNDKYRDLLAKTAKQLKIRPHKVVNHLDEEVELFSSVDCKGIIGNDGRAYILDLLRTFPPDLNYFGTYIADKLPTLSEQLTKMGYPFKHRHLLSTLRQELIEVFHEHLHDRFIGLSVCEYQRAVNKSGNDSLPVEAAVVLNGGVTCDGSGDPSSTVVSDLHHHQSTVNLPIKSEPTDNSLTPSLSSAKATASTSSSDLLLIREKLSNWNSEINECLLLESVRKAAKAVKSSSDTQFVLEFNPDIFQQCVQFADCEKENLESDCQLVYDACDFLVTKQIPSFVQDCLNLCSIPQDGRALVEFMHQRGINVRYLDRIIDVIDNKSSLVYLKRLAVCEILIRSAKHVYNSAYIQDADPMFMSVAIAHFLNSFLTNCPNLTPLAGVEEMLPKLSKNKKSKKKSKNVVDTSAAEEMTWSNVTCHSLWADLVKEAKEYYHYDLDASDIDAFCVNLGVQKVQLLRSFCSSVGIQLLLRDYPLSQSTKQRSKPVFTSDDIVSLFPVVKNLHPHATDAYHYFTTGQAKISSGFIQEGFELVNEALNMLNAVYGLLHPDVGACNRLLGRLSYVMGEHPTALLFQHRAVMISERVHGIDSPNTTTEYIHLALYLFASGRISSALQVLYRARYIALLCHGEEHPEMTQIDTNIGLMLQLVGDFHQALAFFESALKTSQLFYGDANLKEAFTCHLVSRIYAYLTEYRSALDYEKRRYNIYCQRLGLDSDYTRESDAFLRQLTQLAVNAAKRAASSNRGDASSAHIVNGGGLLTGTSAKAMKAAMMEAASSQSDMPLPSLASVLETLNRVNGVIVIQLRTRGSAADKTDSIGDSSKMVEIESTSHATKSLASASSTNHLEAVA